MGAWGTGPFENDAALDFSYEIESQDDLARAFAWAQGDYIDVDEASAVVVAADCVAAMAGLAHPGLPEDLAERVVSFGQPDAALLAQARAALAAVAAASELAELWAESGVEAQDTSGFEAEMGGLAARLAAASASA